MDPELKARWVAALRAGKYEQGTSNLRAEGGYCCLGVLADISGLGQWFEYHEGFFEYVMQDDSGPVPNVASLPLLESFGVDSDNQCNLIEMNDHQRLPFTKIAEWIETNL